MKRVGVSGEIIVIDNASPDGYPQKVANLFPGVRVIRNEENLGFSAANNKAIRLSCGRFLLILNDDALLQGGSLGIMLQALDSDPKIGAVGPQFLNPDGSLQRGFTNRRFPHVRGMLCHTLILEELLEKSELTRDVLTLVRDPDHSGEADHLAGACLLVRREALDAVGLFDQEFQFWFEDVDLCLRLKKAGWRVVYLAEARVTHYGSASSRSRSQAERDAMYFQSARYFGKKHFSPARYRLLRLSVAGALLLRTCFGTLRRCWRDDSTAQERRDWMRARIRVARSLLWRRD
jgi:GT2 family glycosyltransferase